MSNTHTRTTRGQGSRTFNQGRNHLNIQRAARDLNEKVPTRSEALEKIQEQYEIQRAQHEAKKIEKEAKKREEYLSKYKHVDQGNRLKNSLLDEAAGYAPDYNPIETVDDVRQRQQEQLRRDALTFQERKREEEERQKRLEEKKLKERLEQNKHLFTGYRLGGGDRPGFSSQPATNTGMKNKHLNLHHGEKSDKGFRDLISSSTQPATNTGVKNKHHNSYESEKPDKKVFRDLISSSGQPANNTGVKNKPRNSYQSGKSDKKVFKNLISSSTQRATDTGVKNKHRNSYQSEKSDKKGFKDSLSAELLIEGETEEEALQRQEEQLILEVLLEHQMELQSRNKMQLVEKEDYGGKESQSALNSEITNQTEPTKQTPSTPNQGASRNVTSGQLNQLADSSQILSAHPVPNYSKNIGQNNEQVGKIGRNVKIESAIDQPNPEHLETKRSKTYSEPVRSKGLRNTRLQAPATPVVKSEPKPLFKKPASCVLKNKDGAVLLLRPTPEDLNLTLAKRLEVQDEFDKLGYSVHYKPQAEQGPLFENNRFEYRPYIDTVKKPVGAMPKNALTSANKPVPSVDTNDSPSSSLTTKQEEPAIDHKAEMMAARLRLQQRYEEDLKKNVSTGSEK